MAAGFLTAPVIVLVAWVLARCIRPVRPRKTKSMNEKRAKKKDIGLTGKDSWVSSGGHVQGWVFGRKALFDEENKAGPEIWKGKNVLGEKVVWFGGVRIAIPWGRGRSWSQAVSVSYKV